MARLYANENFPFPSVLTLRNRGHTVLTTADTGRSAQSVPDDEVLAYATSRGLAVLTLNRRDFVRLHLRSSAHTGIIACTYDPDFDALARRIDAELAANPDLTGRLLRIHRPPAPG